MSTANHLKEILIAPVFPSIYWYKGKSFDKTTFQAAEEKAKVCVALQITLKSTKTKKSPV